MTGISRLYCQGPEESDALRYGRRPAGPPGAAETGPVVVWNCTRRCNLRCLHCYSRSTDGADQDELSTPEAAGMIDDLAAMGAPAILFSGGEPLLRHDLMELAALASSAGVKAVLSTNGTLIDETVAERLAAAGTAYVGISLDGIGSVHDRFRGEEGAFAGAMRGMAACRQAGLKVGLRFTLTSRNADQVPAIFDLAEREAIGRLCFYHLVQTGRAEQAPGESLRHERTREVLEVIIDRTAQAHAKGRPIQVLTVDNHADGPYVYLRLRRENPGRAAECLRLLRASAGNRSGQSIGCVSWNGDVLPDQFWRTRVLGNVRRRPFSSIWTGDDQPLLKMLRDRKDRLDGRCRRCRWLDVCNGNLRARAEAAGDPWGDDPACYLTEEEIAPDHGPPR